MNEEKISAFIKLKTDRSFIENLALKKKPGGVTAQDIEQAFSMYRSNASALLNAMVKKGRLIKIESRPVYFLSAETLSEYLGNSPKHFTYSADDFFNLFKNYAISSIPTEAPSFSKDAFDIIIGSRASLAEQVNQAKAAISYPPHGLHTLIIGESGTGKTLFSKAMHNFGLKALGKTEKNYPYVAFNCADYYHNPQLLMSQLFGHVRGAFTGADEETAGMVEKADGGILFLDEIHRLPPQGQELLFYLIDTGQYRKLGESDKVRKATVLIIGATTEDPKNVLLKTFIRRIPCTISLPPFRSKPLEEKIQTVESFFVAESTAIQRTFIIKPPVIKALASYEYPGNLGQLASEIKVLCARTFLNNSTTQNELIVEYRCLSAPIRDSLQVLNQENMHFPGNYDFDIIITPSRRIKYSNGLMFDEQSYQALLENINRYTAEGSTKKDLEAALVGDIKDYYNRVLNNFNLKQVNLHEMYKAVDQEIVDFTMEIMQVACNALGLQTTQKNVLVMAFHIKFLLDRLRNKKTVSNDKKVQRSEIKREHARELEAAQQIVEDIEIRFGISVPSDEKYFIALLLAGIDNNEHTDAPRLYIIAHGKSTASSIADVCNRLMDCREAKGIDAPLDQTVEDTYRNFLTALQAKPPQKGAIVLADMGSLVQMGDRAMSETGIPVYTLPNVTTLMALDITRMLCKADDIRTIYHEYLEKSQPVLQTSVRGNAILTVCATGAGTSEAFKTMIHEELERMGLDGIHLESLNYNEVKERSVRYCQLVRNHNILAYVGNIDCGLKIPFFHITKLLSEEGKLNFIKYISGLAVKPHDPAEVPTDETELLKQECCRFLKKNIVYLNPEIAARYALKYIDTLDLPQLADNRPLKLSL
ncbi:MAG TPA: sigma 54-interacting transcriptional regulator, partial [Syntrophomonas sp.]|nr:sigma 54-interacting transcriptional regulator [Syntrophomonas sp.]